MIEGSNELFLTLHLTDGRFHALPYAHLDFVTGDDREWTVLKLVFRLPVILRGQHLQPVFEAIRARRVAHLYEFDGRRCDPPDLNHPTILEVLFENERALHVDEHL
jgi:hypothetical protein